ncbi:spore coat associated protein CotJA [Wukongibacter baidiensis]|uniref:spore coat associated protein CotJA n=1 Tax=Wukongibacter baidiensis TaxID=1723361 RepID=UPI003D7F23AE
MNNVYPAPNMMMGKWQLARPYIINQPFTSIYPPEEALKRGTIFPDLYKPYVSTEKKEVKEWKK